MALTKPKYPLDRTGVAVTNLVSGEVRKVEKTYNRAFAPYGGPFYGDSMVVREKTTNKPLDVGTDYQLIYPYTEAIQNLGKPVFQLVNLVNKTYDEVTLEYQVVGGPYSYSIDSIVKLINDIQQDDRVVSWGNIWGKPLSFNPSAHLHAATDFYGLEYVVLALEELTRSVIQGDVASHNVIYDYVNRVRQQLIDEVARLDQEDADLMKEIERLDARCDTLQTQITAQGQRITNHLNDKGNPHGVTKAQVGLGSVENYRIATTPEAQQGTIDNVYMTPLKTWQEIATYANNNILPVINNHIRDGNNPHNVTKTQVGLGNVSNYRVGTVGEAQQGDSNEVYMTPYLTKLAIQKVAGDMFNGSIQNLQNQINGLQNQINAISTSVAVIGSGGGTLSGLRAGKQYFVMAYGIQANKGTNGDATVGFGTVTDTSGNVLDNAGSMRYNQPDGQAPMTGIYVITAPGNGVINVNFDGQILRSYALQLN
jgi:prefoldin subunit 5